jgi:hypothetical protein
MEKNDFLKKMDELKKPQVVADASRRQVKLTIMNAKKSAFWGIWFLAVPLIFFVCIAIKEWLQWDWGVAAGFIDKMADLDRQTSTKWLTPLLFIVLPAICALANLLAITHFTFDKAARELMITIKTKWLNIALAIISIAFVGMVLLYGIMETAAERAIHRIENNKAY